MRGNSYARGAFRSEGYHFWLKTYQGEPNRESSILVPSDGGRKQQPRLQYLPSIDSLLHSCSQTTLDLPRSFYHTDSLWNWPSTALSTYVHFRSKPILVFLLLLKLLFDGSGSEVTTNKIMLGFFSNLKLITPSRNMQVLIPAE